jgi:hypothetical protein
MIVDFGLKIKPNGIVTLSDALVLTISVFVLEEM